MARTDTTKDTRPPLYLEGLNAFLDLPVKIHTEAGRTRIKISDFLGLAPDSVVELPVSEGDYMSIYANGKLIAHGEILVVEGTMAVRITELIS